MSLPIGRLPRPASTVSSLDPRWKLAAFVVAIGLTAALRSPLAAACSFAGALLLAWLAHLPVRWFVQKLSYLLAPLVLFALPLVFFVRGQGPGWGWGLLLALTVVAKGLAVYCYLLTLLCSSAPGHLLQAGKSLRVPDMFLNVGQLTHRYLFLLLEEWKNMRLALRLRGYQARLGRRSLQTFGSVAGTLFLRAHDRAERVKWAMRCRGFDGSFKTSAAFRTKAADLVAFFLIVFGAAAVGWLDFTLSKNP
jgi:cobalt/nickel transport system permease protein